jgi:hypothetical protein
MARHETRTVTVDGTEYRVILESLVPMAVQERIDGWWIDVEDRARRDKIIAALRLPANYKYGTWTMRREGR